MITNKQTTIQSAIERYGHIDFASKQWPDQSRWMQMLKFDPSPFPNWHVMDTEFHVSAIYCNKDIHQPLSAALEEIKNRKLGHLLLTFDGCFNIRMVRGNPRIPSAHAYGLAIDINADTNALGQTNGGLFDYPELVRCFTSQGFDWGGNFKNRKDPMHFSMCWEGKHDSNIIIPSRM